MHLGRASGILLHPTSLPGPFGIGDLGPAAHRFLDFLAGAGQRLWQVLPLGPTGYGDSPYQCFSAFAGNTLLVSPEALREEGLVEEGDLAGLPDFRPDEVDYAAALRLKRPLLEKAWRHFDADASERERAAFEEFAERERHWLDDYALFMALKEAHGGKAWNRWPSELGSRAPQALGRAREEHADRLGAHRFWQFLFFRQWTALRQAGTARDIRIMGDIPIFVAHDSADVWSHPGLFELDARGAPRAVAGVPPDYFSATGQLWGNPLYRWEAMAREGYAWWVSRFRTLLELVDVVRLDHFRGFEAYWEVPGRAKTAVGGRWVKGPGAALFEALRAALGELPIVAENLGVITPEVEALREQFGFPGMAVLQFAFGSDPQSATFLPHNYPRRRVVYTGTHDNDTTVGWWTSTGEGDSTRTREEIEEERAFARKYLGTDGKEIHWDLIRAALASVADVAIVPMQDVLGLGSEARMNLPASSKGNWRWRCRGESLREDLRQRLRELAEIYGRAPLSKPRRVRQEVKP